MRENTEEVSESFACSVFSPSSRGQGPSTAWQALCAQEMQQERPGDQGYCSSQAEHRNPRRGRGLPWDAELRTHEHMCTRIKWEKEQPRQLRGTAPGFPQDPGPCLLLPGRPQSPHACREVVGSRQSTASTLSNKALGAISAGPKSQSCHAA